MINFNKISRRLEFLGRLDNRLAPYSVKIYYDITGSVLDYRGNHVFEFINEKDLIGELNNYIMQVLGDRLLVKEIEETETESGIILLEEKLKDTDRSLREGQKCIIYEVGNKVKDKNLQKGKKIVITGRSGMKTTIEGKEYIVVREANVEAYFE